MAAVILDHVSKRFGQGAAVDDLSLEVRDGELLVIVGRSGCGKTTTLRMLAGLEDPTSGTIRIGDRVVNDVAPKDRNVAMVFQHYALFPHMTVLDNLAFGMRVRREPKQEIDTRIHAVAETLGISPLMHRRPGQLSGGEQQRVALGRAMLRRPQVLLMDEPLSNLDATLRIQMRSELTRLQKDLSVTTVHVTHDQVEAMTMGDRIAFMRDGRLEQIDAPERIYDFPANLHVATFIGALPMNLAPGTLVACNQGIGVQWLGLEVPLVNPSHKRATSESREVIVGIRPEDLRPVLGGASELMGIDGTVEIVEPMGVETYVLIRRFDTLLTTRFPLRSGVRVGDHVQIAFNAERLHVFDKVTGLAVSA